MKNAPCTYKHVGFTLMFFMAVQTLFAQVPQLVNYQGVVRNTNGDIIPNQAIGVQFSIHDSSQMGTVVYQETQALVSNSIGVITAQVGAGTVINGTMAGINWASGVKYLQVQVDPAGGSNYTINGTSQLLSVPYALYAANSGGSGWGLNGNAGTAYGTNFIGTTDAQNLIFKVNDTISGRVEDVTNGNTSLGYAGLRNVTSGTNNTALGMYALEHDTSGRANVAIGMQSLKANSSGIQNTAVGTSAMLSNIYGNYNTATGFQALASNAFGSSNVANGFDALFSSTTGTLNTAVGYQAMANNNTGNINSALGGSALTNNSAGNANTATGYYALGKNTTGGGNVALGAYACSSAITVSNQVAVGDSALLNLNSGVGANTAIGYQSQLMNASAGKNTSVGYQSLYSATTGGGNTVVGYQALYANFNGSSNVAIGANALQNDTASYNTAVGRDALISNTMGIYNSALGFGTLLSNTGGNSNVALGYYALNNNTTGSNNTALGFQADVSADTLTNATALGSDALVNASNKVQIGSSSVLSIGGQVGWTNYSDGRVKDNVQSNVPGLAFISLLQPVTYHYSVDKENALLGVKGNMGRTGKYDIEKITFSGFIAQDVDASAQSIGYNFSGVDKSGAIMGLRYADFVPALVKAIQEQQQTIEQLKKRLEVLESK